MNQTAIAAGDDAVREMPVWDDQALFNLSRDTTSWLTHGPDGGTVGDWFDGRVHTILLYYLAKNINWPDPRLPRPMLPPRVLEIGVRHGVSSLALLHAMRETGGHLTSIEVDPEWARAATAAVTAAGLMPWWDLRVIHSDAYAREARTELDLLWIDGDHSEEQVRTDVEHFGPLVRAGGIMALHDYYSLPIPCHPPVCPPFPSHVSIVVEQLRQVGGWEILTLPFSYGVTLCKRNWP